MTLHLTDHRQGFQSGYTAITVCDEAVDNTGIALGILNLAIGAQLKETVDCETAYLLMQGECTVELEDHQMIHAKRDCLFDQNPWCIHVAAGTELRLHAEAACEWAVLSVPNTLPFETRVFTPELIRQEARGKGQVGEACLRTVRTIFDRENSDPNCELVLGEVITLPGRWSSYPPHHHPHPEIYHYRFTHPQGYGHGEAGEAVFKIKAFDTLKIPPFQDHAQCAAPGYGMYYLWVIRHLPNQPYSVPEFTAEHAWILQSQSTSE